MRISDWSSDVCSSDLLAAILEAANFRLRAKIPDQNHLVDAACHIVSCRLANWVAVSAAHMKALFIVPERSPSRRSEEHTSELQSLMRISYAVFCLKKKTTKRNNQTHATNN